MPESEQDKDSGFVKTNRRRFLGGSMAAAVGLGLASAGSGAVTDEALAQTAAQGNVDSPKTYSKLDPEKLKPEGRKNFHAGMHCAEGTFHTIVDALRDDVGGEWEDIPTTVTWWGAGGGALNGATCGSIIGAASAIAAVHGRSNTTMKLVNELFQFYAQHPFPEYQPPGNAEGMTKELAASRANSPLCHVSVTNWCKASGHAWGSKERGERCSRLVADMVGRTVEVLNAEADGSFDKVSQQTAQPATLDSEKGCRACHSSGNSFDQGGFVEAKMECTQCHNAAPHLPDSLQK